MSAGVVDKALWPLIEARCPEHALALYAWILWREQKHLPSTSAEACSHFGISHKTLTRRVDDLAVLGVVDVTGHGREMKLRAKRVRNVSRIRRRSDGKVARCARYPDCHRVADKGAWCWRCRQTHGRVDRWWWDRCDKLLRESYSPTRVQVILDRERRERIAAGTLSPEAPAARLWDHVVEGQQQPSPGIVSRGLMLGVLPESWRERQREALSGADDDF